MIELSERQREIFKVRMFDYFIYSQDCATLNNKLRFQNFNLGTSQGNLRFVSISLFLLMTNISWNTVLKLNLPFLPP